MGTWGTALFSDDTAADIRDTYRDLLGDGFSGPDATDALLRDWEGQVTDPDIGPIFWLALAATQWRCGRLEDRVRAKAFEIIDSGADLRHWQNDSRGLERRQAVLGNLREELRSPPPPPKRVRKRFRDFSEWQRGEVIGYRLASGNFALFRLIGFHTDRGGTSPVFELLNWLGTELPSEEAMRRLPLLQPLRPVRAGTGNQFIISRLRERELPQDRIVRTGIRLRPSQAPGAFTVFLWKYLDRFLEGVYGIA